MISKKQRLQIVLSGFLTGCLLFHGAADAEDTVLLKSGRTLHGKVKEGKDEKTGKFIDIQTASGSFYRLDYNDSVKSVTYEDESNFEYRDRLRNMANNATAHMELAEWCRKQPRGSTRFKEQIAWHFENIIRFDPEHVVARRKLGYIKLDDGSWVLEDLYAEKYGYVKDGRYFAPAIIEKVRNVGEIEDSARNEKKAAFLQWLRSMRRGGGSAMQLQQLCDETSIEFIAKQAQDDREKNSVELRRVYLDAIGTVKTSSLAISALAEFAMKDPDRSVREHAIALLSQPEFNHVTAVSFLKAGLVSPINATVRNAGFAIGEVCSSDDYSRDYAILPLAKSLSTTHEFATGNLEAGRLNPTFGNGGSGLQTGGGPQSVNRDVQNDSSLTALRRLVEVDFQYDEKAWTNWYIGNFTRYNMTVRDDP